MLQFYNTNKIEAGCDEAGRGCLAGPVFAAAVVLKNDFFHPLLDDSKKVTPKNRTILKDYIIANAIDWAVAMVDNNEIDKINILNASIRSMHLALEQLKIKPEIIVVDGNKFKPFRDIEYKTIVDGDAKIVSIAAASILAKVFRDEYMMNKHNDFPYYNWNKNKGYPTKEHKNAIFSYGLSPLHRKSFCSFYFDKKLDL